MSLLVRQSVSQPPGLKTRLLDIGGDTSRTQRSPHHRPKRVMKIIDEIMTTVPTLDMRQRTDYLKYGSSGPWVVMLHSSMSSKRQWHALSQRLSPRYHVLALDLIGYGDSPVTFTSSEERFSLEQEANHVAQRIRTLLPRDTKFHLIGHSYGGAVALRLAQAMQAQIKTLTVYEPTAFHLLQKDHPALSAVRDVASIVAESSRPESTVEAALIAAEVFIDFWSGVGTFAGMDERRQLATATMLAKTKLDFKALFGDGLTTDDYRKLMVRTCVISGSTSPNCVHQIVATLAEALPSCDLRWVPAGHMAPITHPQFVNSVIEMFLHTSESRTRAVDTCGAMKNSTWPARTAVQMAAAS